MAHIKALVAATMTTLTEEPKKENTRISEELNNFDWGFQTFDDKELIAALKAAKIFVSDILSGKQPRWLSLLGVSGVGKTYLMRKISHCYKYLIQASLYNAEIDAWQRGTGKETVHFKCYRGAFADWTTVASRVLDRDRRVVYDLAGLNLLCLDDIGAEYENKFINAKLYELLNMRLGKWTVITSNRLMEDIEKMDVRISSRMIRGGSKVVSFEKCTDFNLR